MLTNILALDLGKKSLGLAISRSGILVSELPNLHFNNMDYNDAIKKLLKAIEYEKIEHVVIGLPLYPSGDECEMTPIVRKFVDNHLKQIFPNIEIEFMDERDTTLEASEILHMNNMNAKKQKSIIDSQAAMMILERYLKKIGQL